LNIDLLIRGEAPVEIAELTCWAGPSEVSLCAAGSAGYIAQDLARFGLKTSLVSTLADDPFGDALLQILNGAGLDTSHVDRQPGTLSGIGIYMLLFGSRKRPLTYRLPTHLPWPKPFTRKQEKFLLEGHRHLHSAGYLHFPAMWGDEMAHLFRKAKKRGLSTSLDPQFVLFPVPTPWLDPLRGLLEFTDLLFVDEDEARTITLETDLKKVLAVLKELGPQVVVVKQGERGSLLYDHGSTRHLPAVRVPEKELVDSIGAGDAFDTGMIYAFLRGWSMARAQKFATLSAASTLRGVGGTDSLADVEELTKASLA
jgi:sugar/nucleoside kinase (ribokinase family)